MNNENRRNIYLSNCLAIISAVLLECSILIGVGSIIAQLLGVTADIVGLSVQLCGGGALLQIPFLMLRYRERQK